jgi:excisionase family DNA binding protein
VFACQVLPVKRFFLSWLGCRRRGSTTRSCRGCGRQAAPITASSVAATSSRVADLCSDVNRFLATDATPRLLKADELAKRWGLHRATVYRLVQRGELPALRIGGSIRDRSARR